MPKLFFAKRCWALSLYSFSLHDSRSLDESCFSRWYDPRWFPLIALQSFRFNFRWYLANGFLGDLSPSFHLPALAWCPSPGTGSAWCARNTMTSAQWLLLPVTSMVWFGRISLGWWSLLTMESLSVISSTKVQVHLFSSCQPSWASRSRIHS